MLKKSKFIIFLIVILALFLIAPLKREKTYNVILIGSVKWSEIVFNFKEYQDAVSALEKEKNEKLFELKEKYEQNPEEVNVLALNLQKEYNKKEELLKEKYRKKIIEAIKNVASRRGITLVLNDSAVLYSVVGITDITYEVIEELNKKED